MVAQSATIIGLRPIMVARSATIIGSQREPIMAYQRKGFRLDNRKGLKDFQ